MGYTHYWSGSAECDDATWAAIIRDCKNVIAASGILIGEGGGDGGLPTLNHEIIELNGVSSESHETFQVWRREGLSGFCKTAQKPYDIVVAGCLIVLSKYLPKFQTGSDGDTGDWADAIALCQRELGYGIYPCWQEDEDGIEHRPDWPAAVLPPEPIPTEAEMSSTITVSRVKPDGRPHL